MVDHRVEIGRQCAYPVVAGDFAVQHVQQVGHMAETGVRCHGFFSVKKTPVGRHDGRQTGHQGPGVRRVVHGRKGRGGHANGVDDGAAFLRGTAQQIEGDSGKRAPLGQFTRETIQGARSGQRSVPKKVDHLLVSRTFRDLLEWISPDDQYAGFAIDMTEPGFRRYDVLESG